MTKKVVRPRIQDREERKPKYFHNLVKKVEQRKWEQEIVYADKDKFVTSAYKKKLAEQAKWMEEERLPQLREEKDDIIEWCYSDFARVTRKRDLSDFYFNLEINTELRKSEKKDEEIDVYNSVEPLPDSNALESSRTTDRNQDETSCPQNHESRFQDSRPNITIDTLPDTAVQESPLEKQISVDQPKRDHHKRGEHAVTAGRERFLPRKRAKQQ
ncbi:hypothetical protein ES332_D05G087000v1 [Gossypium tomentosum]|uniref:Nuclear speckle splicing regulatory protein 1 N-terminal domain-containing protein n=1 Tax=Gossypium tomentosum TaxID=34277 RepID=A0A5D2KT29_GOSTO|nr:hypothetical protein ES332_D05G087000v1 [Gossypium tomentosum]